MNIEFGQSLCTTLQISFMFYCRSLVHDSSLSHDVLPHLAKILRQCVDQFLSPLWAARNAGSSFFLFFHNYHYKVIVHNISSFPLINDKQFRQII